MKIIWSPRAIERVQDISDYIAADSGKAAAKWIESVFKKVRSLKYFPNAGRVVPEIKKSNIKEIFHGEYRIIYKTFKSHIAILTVRHGKRRFSLFD